MGINTPHDTWKDIDMENFNGQGPELHQNNGKQRKPKKPLGPLWIAVYALIGCVFVYGVVLVVREYVLLPNIDYVSPTPRPIVTTPPADTPSPGDPAASSDPEASPEPTRKPIMVPTIIYFDDHKQQCPIIVVGIGEGGGMDSPLNATEAGWFYYGASPGDKGTAIINGHQRFSGQIGTFSILKSSKPGERIIIEFDSGVLRYFEIERVETYEAKDIPEEYLRTGTDTETRLILITCLGDYGSDGYSKSRVLAICNELTELRQEGDI